MSLLAGAGQCVDQRASPGGTTPDATSRVTQLSSGSQISTPPVPCSESKLSP
jgi:hypothetical protein